jgi:hypothetical protein
MKVLFFHATSSVGHPKVLPAFEGQVRDTLRPFNRFLGQAIHTAKQRQFRYQLPWERVRNMLALRLDPQDSRLRVPRRRPGTIITNWPADRDPDLQQFAFVVNRGVPVRVVACTRVPTGLLVRTEPPLAPADSLLWCGTSCELAQEGESLPPRQVVGGAGRPLELVGTPLAEGDDHWVLVVRGQHGDCDLRIDGEEVEAQALSPFDGLRRVLDGESRSFDVSGELLRTEEPPAAGPVHGDNGVRFEWRETEKTGRRGNWVQLLPPESAEADEFLDARAAFCEGDVSEVWTSKSHRKDETYRVKKVDQDRYQLLLDRIPPEGTTLFLPVDIRNLHLQKRALRQLLDAPLPHHRGLLRLCEDPERVRWPAVEAEVPDQWFALTDPTRSGTEEQREFVVKALGSPDLAFLEGPPGSGKTTAICEIVQQLVAQGQRVLLCASTHVAIDNVLERLLGGDTPIDAVRIGKQDKVDDKVQACQLDARIEALVGAWRALPTMRGFGDAELREMAERAIIMAANLTCGTTMGIVNHPLFRGRDEDLHVSERPITTMPHWDVLIVDEASKTLIQEFMVPALMARRWIIVGDVRQLPPFTDRADIVANLRDLVDDKDRPIFPRDHQRACLLLFRLLHKQTGQSGMRWLLVEPPGVLGWIARELEADPARDLSVVRVVARGGPTDGPIHQVTVRQLETGAPEALRLAAADWVLVAEDLIKEVSRLLPSNLLLTRDLSSGNKVLEVGDPLLLRQGWWLARAGRLQDSYTEKKFRRDPIDTFTDAQACEIDWLRRQDLGQELTWRLTRLHELRRGRHERERDRLNKAIERMLPAAVNIAESIAEIEDIGLPSILEVLQEGIGVERSKRRSALTAGMRAGNEQVFVERFQSLSYQHRMHPQIAEFSRLVIYQDASLKDANTIQSRDARLGWDFGRFRSRRVWASVRGRESSGENQDEVRVVAALLREFIDWARRHGPPKRDAPGLWEVACLCFYVKQERALSQMLQDVTGDERKTRFLVRGAPVEIVCGTVDRFQGREADLVMLSMRNTERVGFLDSPNRLNVAVTRARQQLVIVGNAEYFGRCGTWELEELVRRTPLVDDPEVQRWRRGHR